MIIGDSGAGKSDLALRLIDDGAVLVSDDQVRLAIKDKQVFASAPNRIKGMLEVRGIGVMKLAYADNVSVHLVIKLVEADMVERMPENRFFDCLGLQVPLLSLHAFHLSTAAKIRLFLSHGL